VLAPDAEAVRELARSLGRVAAGCDLRVAALGPDWVDPTEADLLVSTPVEALDSIGSATLKLDRLSAVVVSEASVHEGTAGLGAIRTLLGLAPAGAQRVITSLPLTKGVRALVQEQVRKGVEVPVPVSVDEHLAEPRGALTYVTVGGRKEDHLLEFLGRRHESGPVLVFARTEDGAADVADLLTLHGYLVGRPAEEATDVWVAADAREARGRLTEAQSGPLLTVSFDVPTGADELDLRHGKQAESVVFVRPRELAHLHAVAVLAHYTIQATPEPTPPDRVTELARLREELAETAASEDIAPYLATIEPLLEQHSGAELAAAALLLLRTRRRDTRSDADSSPSDQDAMQHPSLRGARPFVRLFLSIGSKDRVRAGDIVGAIAGESGVEGGRVGKVDIRETFSLVEVEDVVAERIIRALNGTTIRGRSVRADLDRGGRKSGPPGR
jgi:ATP-dependent RNA helicase DeaD